LPQIKKAETPVGISALNIYKVDNIFLRWHYPNQVMGQNENVYSQLAQLPAPLILKEIMIFFSESVNYNMAF